ncbi:MAG: hypothetical protein EOO41_01015 [Methanobacteriota archaeon]|nr:MAG: hypothetical protein EOO41_01015 [Euryarchaeota archaeon]
MAPPAAKDSGSTSVLARRRPADARRAWLATVELCASGSYCAPSCAAGRGAAAARTPSSLLPPPLPLPHPKAPSFGERMESGACGGACGAASVSPALSAEGCCDAGRGGGAGGAARRALFFSDRASRCYDFDAGTQLAGILSLCRGLAVCARSLTS